VAGKIVKKRLRPYLTYIRLISSKCQINWILWC